MTSRELPPRKSTLFYVMKKLTHEDFLSMLPIERSYVLKGKYEGMLLPIIIKDKFGLVKTKPAYLVKNVPISPILALDKTEYYKNRFIEKHQGCYSYEKFIFKGSHLNSIMSCSIHGDYEQTPSNHLKGHGCYRCNIKNNGYNKQDFINSSKGKTAKFYILRCWDDKEEFYKVGITAQKVRSRFIRKRDMPYKYEVLKVIESQDAGYIWSIERKHKKELREYSYTPLQKFAGSASECYFINPLKQK